MYKFQIQTYYQCISRNYDYKVILLWKFYSSERLTGRQLIIRPCGTGQTSQGVSHGFTLLTFIQHVQSQHMYVTVNGVLNNVNVINKLLLEIKTSIVWAVTSWISKKSRSTGERYRFQPHGPSKKPEAGVKPGLLFHHEEGGGMFVRNVGFSSNYATGMTTGCLQISGYYNLSSFRIMTAPNNNG
jgi:hypothetical protein